MPEVKVVNNKEDFKVEADLGNVVVWNGKDKLYSVLEDLELADGVKYRLKACYEINYKDGITFSGTNEKFETDRLSELLKRKLEFNKNDKIIVKSNDTAEVLKTIQQLIYLSQIVDIYTNDEVSKKSIIDRFYKNAEDIKKAVINFQTQIRNYKTNIRYILDRKKHLEKLTEEILKKIDETKDKTIKVAVLATKKTGKSMIVNGLLGEEYAPTSQELATPNVIEYIPYDGREIILEYKNSVKSFNSPKEIKEYIEQLFKEVNLEGKKLPVMRVKYPRIKGINYEIYDTPGPDLAGSEHHEFINEYIQKSDVIIFAIDYSKYAQNSEIELLEKIKNFFEENDKNYSLICVINKIDLMFQDASTEKNKIRATDFIYNKMETLGFKKFIVLPLSALTYFYANKVIDVYKKYKDQDISKGNFYNELYDFKRKYSRDFSEEEKTYVSFVYGILDKVVDFYDLENPTYHDLINWSGFPYLLEYINYVVENKAMLEKSWSILSSIESKITQIENDIAAKKLLNKEINELEIYLRDFLREVEEIYTQKKIEQFFEDIKSRLREFFIKEVSATVYREIKKGVRGSFEKCKEELEKSLDKFIKNYNIPEETVELGKYTKDEIISSFKKEVNVSLIDKKTIEELINNIRKESLKNINFMVDGIINKIKNLRRDLEGKKERIREKIDKLNENLKKNYNFSVELKLPKLEPDTSYILTEIDEAVKSIQKKLSDLANQKLQSEDILQFEEYRKVYSYKKWFKTYKKVHIRYKISGAVIRKQLQKALSDFERKLDNILKEIRFELESMFRKVELRSLNESIDITKEGYISGFNAIIDPITRIVQELKLEKSNKEEIYNFLSFVENQFEEINKYFYSVSRSSPAEKIKLPDISGWSEI